MDTIQEYLDICYNKFTNTYYNYYNNNIYNISNFLSLDEIKEHCIESTLYLIIPNEKNNILSNITKEIGQEFDSLLGVGGNYLRIDYNMPFENDIVVDSNGIQGYATNVGFFTFDIIWEKIENFK